MNDQELENEIQEKGLNAPRVSLDSLHAKVEHTEIVKHVSKSGQVLRWAVLTTQNGYAVTGDPSCAVSSENDDTEIGEKIAIKNAEDRLWQLEGYLLKQKNFEIQKLELSGTYGKVGK